MFELIAFLVIGVAVAISVLVLTGVFMTYLNQTSYVEERYDDNDD
jgi:hypothetical protein